MPPSTTELSDAEVDGRTTTPWNGEIRVLGPPVVHVDGRVVELRGVNAVLLSTLISVSPDYIERDTLLDTLWPDAQVGKGALHTAVSRLRAAIGDREGDVLQRRGTGYRVDVASDHCDLLHFQEQWATIVAARACEDWMAVTDAVESALDRWRGEPFGGIDTAHVQVTTEALRRQRTDVIEAGAEAALSTGAATLWIENLQRLLDADPTRTSATLLKARCYVGSGDYVGALRCLNTSRRHTARAGLDPDARLAALERHVLEFFDRVTRRHIEHTALSIDDATALLDGADAKLRLHAQHGPSSIRWDQHIRDPAQRVIAAADRDGHLDAHRSRAWHLVGVAAEWLDQPLQVRQAAINALRCAISTSDTIALEHAATLSMRAVWPSEPNAGVLDVIRRARSDAERHPGWSAEPRVQALMLAVEAVHRATMRDVDAGAEAATLADQARHVADDTDSATTRKIVVEAWMMAHEGHDGHDQQIAAASELCELDAGAVDRARHHLFRARLGLAGGDRMSLNADLDTIDELTDRTGDRRCRARATQLRATIAMAEGDWDEARRHIEWSEAALAGWPVEQEIGFVQRWWCALDDDPDGVEAMADLAATVEVRPAHQLILGYTHFRLGDNEAARRHLETVWPADRLLVPLDSTYPVSIVGAVQLSAALGDHRRLGLALHLLRPYDGQLIVAGDGIFTPGAAARFVDLAESELAPRSPTNDHPSPSRERATRLERSFGGDAFVDVCDRRMLCGRGTGATSMPTGRTTGRSEA